MKTEVILTHNIVGLGAESDQVKVAPGFARNYLFPQRLAIPLTQANRRHIEALKRKRAEREAHEFNTMSELAKGVQKLICVIKVKTGDDGKMFGSVTAGMIADELKHQFDITLDKRKIHLEHPIKALGEYEIDLHLHHDVKSTLKVQIQSLTPLAAPATPAPETKSEDSRKPRTEKRGHGKHADAEKAEAAPEGKEKKSHAKESHAAKGEKHAKARHEKPEKKSKAE
ncbi:MAG TPA: 50S ribosomal protein L9 [Verrucomicrobiae bacterium]|jgi:large subunit ribosomal protein L9|nr:50S ribosomal protein L9 [Verrucomicrobiae bacterium]